MKPMATVWSREWAVALDTANRAARQTGFRYRVRRSHARPERWLIMQALPRQRVPFPFGRRHG